MEFNEVENDTQLRDVIDTHSYTPIKGVFKEYFHQMQRGKYLSKYQFLSSYYLITIDGSQYFTSESIHCKKCLHKKTKVTLPNYKWTSTKLKNTLFYYNWTSTKLKNESLRYYHQIVQATLVHPDMRQVFPLAPEFIRNEDGNKKQDCERNAAKRLLYEIKQDHPHLPIIICGDSLYSNQPFITNLNKHKFSYILVAKPDDHKSLYEDSPYFNYNWTSTKLKNPGISTKQFT